MVYYKLRDRVINFICKYYNEDITEMVKFKYNIDSPLTSVTIKFENGNVRTANIEFNLDFGTVLIYAENDKGKNESEIYKTMYDSFYYNIGEYIIHKETGVLYKVIEYRDDVLLLNETYALQPFLYPYEFLKTDIKEVSYPC